MVATLYHVGEAATPTKEISNCQFSVVIYMHDLSGGGVERQTLALARQLQAAGLRVTLLLHEASGDLSNCLPPNIRVVDLHSRRTLQDIPLIARFLRREQPDVMVANLDHNNVAALLGNLLAGLRTKVIICQHNAMSAAYYRCLSWSYRLIPAAYGLLSPFIGKAVAVSEGVGRELRAIGHIPQHKITVIHNSVIDRDFERRAQQPVAHKWFDQPGAPLFVTAGRLVALKDHETMLRALAIHRRQQPSRLLILGTGPLRESLAALAAELGLHDAVDFLGFTENPLPFFRRSDAFILSSYTEGFGNVLVEAMGCGTPVISTDCEYGPSEILNQGEYGVLVPPRSPVGLARAMDMVGDLRRLWPANELKARAREFSDTACAAKYIQLIESLVPEHA